jgi:hypothetical protein
MLRFWRITIIITTLSLIGAFILLQNFTAPNPTGRRYSSEPVLTAQQGATAQAIGLSAEVILARDLGIPRNEDAGQRQCLCSNASYAGTRECNTCAAIVPSIHTIRRPDFVDARYIVEVKNRANLLYAETDQVEQIADYADAARLMRRPLWLFVRVDTTLSAEFHRIVESTGGGVVYYFVTPGFIDPVSQAAQVVSVVSGILLVLSVIALWRYPHKAPASVAVTALSATRAISNAEEQLADIKRRVRRQFDDERGA